MIKLILNVIKTYMLGRFGSKGGGSKPGKVKPLYTNNGTKFISSSVALYFLLVLVYFVLEIIFNYKMTYMLSVQSTEGQINFLEYMGRTLSGIGVGLAFLASKPIIESYWDKGSKIFSGIIFCFLWGIFLSFVLQTGIVHGLVAMGTEEEKAKAMLIAQVKNTMVPFYSPPYTIQSDTIQPAEYFDASRECRDEGYGLKMDSVVDRIAFPFKAMYQKYDEEKYIKIVNDFNKCLVDKTVMPKIKALEIPDEVPTRKQAERELWAKYQEMNNEYLKHSAKHNQISGFGQQAYRGKIQSEWIKGSKALFGRHSIVSPNLNRTKFFKHEDVISLLDRQRYREDIKKDYDKNVARTYKDALEEPLKKYYFNRHHISGLEDLKIPRWEHDLTFKQKVQDAFHHDYGELAYKSVVVPIVVLFFSLFFMIYSLFSLVIFLINRYVYLYRSRSRLGMMPQFVGIALMLFLVFGSQHVAKGLPEYGLVVANDDKNQPTLYQSDEMSKPLVSGLMIDFVYVSQKQLLKYYENPPMPQFLVWFKPKVEVWEKTQY